MSQPVIEGSIQILSFISNTGGKGDTYSLTFSRSALPSGYLSMAGISGVGFLRSKEQPSDLLYPYLQLLLFGSLLGSSNQTYETTKNILNAKDEASEPAERVLVPVLGFLKYINSFLLVVVEVVDV